MNLISNFVFCNSLSSILNTLLEANYTTLWKNWPALFIQSSIGEKQRITKCFSKFTTISGHVVLWKNSVTYLFRIDFISLRVWKLTFFL